MKSLALPPFQIFGSQDSIDLDIVFFITIMPDSILEKATLAKHWGELLKDRYPDKRINANFAVCKEGSVTEVYKGSADELNNALYHTYALHDQAFERQIEQTLPRDKNLKALRCLRVVLSLCSKTPYRESVKEALRLDIYRKIATLKEIDFNTINGFGKSQNIVEVKKTIAFQLGQTLALLQGQECYTKSEIVAFYPDLHPYLYRSIDAKWHTIQFLKEKFLSELNLMVPHMKHTQEYPYQRDQN